MSPWIKVDENSTTSLWEARLPGGAAIRVPSRERPPAWIVGHHYSRFGSNPPKAELGATGYRFLFPGETRWREYGYAPKDP